MLNKWVCGYYGDELVLTEIRVRETPCYFLIDTQWDEGRSFRQVASLFRSSNRLAKRDRRLFDARDEAIQAQIKIQQDSRETFARKMREAADRINVLLQL